MRLEASFRKMGSRKGGILLPYRLLLESEIFLLKNDIAGIFQMITVSSLLDRDRKRSFLAPHYVNLMGLLEVKLMEFWCYPLGLCHSGVLSCILVHIQPPAVQEKWLFQCSHQPLVSAASALGKQISVRTGFAQLTDWGGGGSFTLWPQFSDDSKKSCLFLVWPSFVRTEWWSPSIFLSKQTLKLLFFTYSHFLFSWGSSISIRVYFQCYHLINGPDPCDLPFCVSFLGLI